MSLSEKTKTVISALTDLIDSCSEEELHFKPTPDSWNILACAEHILLVNSTVYRFLQSPPPTLADNKVSELHSEGKMNHILVTKRDIKRIAPEWVVPKSIFKTGEEAKQAIQKDTTGLLNILEKTDISKETHTVAHPAIGEMTKTDWMHFLISHTQRHLFQIEEIKEQFRRKH